jgi:hypothetical protein
MTSNLSLTGLRDIKCNNIFLNYLNDISNILDVFALKNELTSIVGLPPSTLDTIQKLAEALGNNPDFFNYVDQQLALKRNVSDSYDKNYINTLIAGYYTKTQTDTNLLLKANQATTYNKTEVDNNLLLKSDKLTTYNKTEVDTNLLLKQNKLILPPSEGANGWGTIDSTGTVRRIVGSAPIRSFIELDIDNPSTINDIKIGLDLELSNLINYYTKTQTDTLITNLIGNAPALLNTLNELAAALNNDQNYATTIQNQIATKASIINPTFTNNVLIKDQLSSSKLYAGFFW